MHWIDWCIVIIPVVLLLAAAIYSRKYVRGVVDYLAAGRVAGRYVICVGDLEAGLGIITLAALVESKYRAGYALMFWEIMVAPVGILMALTGYCVYRFRETRSLSIGQFLEMRYSRNFRMVAATIRTLAEMLTNALGPAVAANFFIYYMGFPHSVSFLGITLPTFAVVVGSVLIMAIVVMWPGGRVSLLITDCIQGLMSYPIFVIITVFVLTHYSWDGEIAPVMLDRVKGESFLNPFDIEKLRDFNAFALFVTVVGRILNRASWIGNDTTSSGRTPHEQKMAGVLGSWRNGFAWMMCTLIAITIITVMNHSHHAELSRDIRVQLSNKVLDQVVEDKNLCEELKADIEAIPVQRHIIGEDGPLSQEENLETVYLSTVKEKVGGTPEGNSIFQEFRTFYNQMMMPMALRRIFPVGLCGIFCLLMIMMMLSTDDSRIFNSSSTIIQDIILPLKKEPFTPEQHLLWLRWGSVLVSVFFFLCTLLFKQLDYIQMFITIMCAVWLGGAGPVMIFGLYSRFGNTWGAYTALFFGCGLSTVALVIQRIWADTFYPMLDNLGLVDTCDSILRTVSGPFEPYVVWRMDPVKFPINSYEVYFLAMVLGTVGYVIVSLLTNKKPYNLDRLLHRGKYSVAEDDKHGEFKWTWKHIFGKLIGITPDYTTGDKVIAWSVFCYTFIYQIGLCFVVVLIWNRISPWPDEWWSTYFFTLTMVVGGTVGAISTVWFLIGGIIDGRRLFRDLEARVDNPLDDGRVVGHVSLVDKDAFGGEIGEDEDY